MNATKEIAANAQPVSAGWTLGQEGGAYAELPTPNLPRGGFPDLFTADQMRAYADDTYALRASHGQAPAATPSGVAYDLHQRVESLIDKESELPDELVRLANIMRDCGRLISKSGNAERVLRAAAVVLRASHGQAPAGAAAELAAAWSRLSAWWNDWASTQPQNDEIERAEWDEWQAVRRAMAKQPAPTAQAAPAAGAVAGPRANDLQGALTAAQVNLTTAMRRYIDGAHRGAIAALEKAQRAVAQAAEFAAAPTPAAGAVAGPEWKLVPVKPTPEMVHAVRFAGDPDAPPIGAAIIAGETAYPFVGEIVAERMCRAMLAAAPTPAAQADSQTAPDVDLIARGMRWDECEALMKEACAQAGVQWDEEKEPQSIAINVMQRLANAAHKVGFTLGKERMAAARAQAAPAGAAPSPATIPRAYLGREQGAYEVGWKDGYKHGAWAATTPTAQAAQAAGAVAGVVNRIPLLDENDPGCALVRTTRGWDFRRNGNLIRHLNLYERLFVESALAAAPTPAAGAVAGQWPDICDGKEQEAWEAWAQRERYNMAQHPLHYLFLNGRADAARQGWKAGLLYAVEQMKAAAPTPAAQASNAR